MSWALFALGALSAYWIALKLRVLPKLLCQIWFALTFLLALLALNWTGFFLHNILHKLCGVAHERTALMVAWFIGVVMKVHIVANPQIVMHHDAESLKVMDRIRPLDPTGGALFISNHTSFFDGFGLWSICRLDQARVIRTLYKKSLENIPLWGATYARALHFPVHFTSDESFSVDKEKQAAVSADMVSWVRKGGLVGLFPEGQINRGDPRVIQPIRHGSIRFAIENNLPFFCAVQYGAWNVWPPKAAIGGFPADYFYKAKMFELPKELVEKTQTRGEPLTQADVEGVADALRAMMQEMLDEMTAKAESGKKKD